MTNIELAELLEDIIAALHSSTKLVEGGVEVILKDQIIKLEKIAVFIEYTQRDTIKTS